MASELKPWTKKIRAVDDICADLKIGRFELCHRVVTPLAATRVKTLPEKLKVYSIGTEQGCRYTLDKPPEEAKKDHKQENLQTVTVAEAAGMAEMSVPAMRRLLIERKIEYIESYNGHLVIIDSLRKWIDENADMGGI